MILEQNLNEGKRSKPIFSTSSLKRSKPIPLNTNDLNGQPPLRCNSLMVNEI